jgi:phytoene/squalene synthetase
VFKGFVAGKTQKYEQLKGEAMRLGSAFQKVNFLREKEDNLVLNRNYFPELNSFDEEAKNQLLRKLKRILGLPTKELCCLSKQNLEFIPPMSTIKNY